MCQAAADACPELRIATIQAGDKRNAIAREGRAVVLVPAAHAASAAAAMAEHIEALTQSYSRFETAMHIDATTTQVRIINNLPVSRTVVFLQGFTKPCSSMQQPLVSPSSVGYQVMGPMCTRCH